MRWRLDTRQRPLVPACPPRRGGWPRRSSTVTRPDPRESHITLFSFLEASAAQIRSGTSEEPLHNWQLLDSFVCVMLQLRQLLTCLALSNYVATQESHSSLGPQASVPASFSCTDLLRPPIMSRSPSLSPPGQHLIVLGQVCFCSRARVLVQ